MIPRKDGHGPNIVVSTSASIDCVTFGDSAHDDHSPKIDRIQAYQSGIFLGRLRHQVPIAYPKPAPKALSTVNAGIAICAIAFSVLSAL